MPDKPAGLTLDVTRNRHGVVVCCHGSLVLGTHDILFSRVKQLLPDEKRIILDLNDLTRMDSMGLGTLVRLYVSARASGSTLELIHLGKQVKQMLVTANLLSAFTTVGEHYIKMG